MFGLSCSTKLCSAMYQRTAILLAIRYCLTPYLLYQRWSKNLQAAIVSLAGKWKRFMNHNVVTDLLLLGPAVG